MTLEKFKRVKSTPAGRKDLVSPSLWNALDSNVKVYQTACCLRFTFLPASHQLIVIPLPMWKHVWMLINLVAIPVSIVVCVSLLLFKLRGSNQDDLWESARMFVLTCVIIVFSCFTAPNFILGLRPEYFCDWISPIESLDDGFSGKLENPIVH